MNDITISAFQEVPRILLIDFEVADAAFLTSKGFNYTAGTLGTQIEVPKNTTNDEHICLSNHNFPPNLHEFNILLVNLQYLKTIPYNPSDHQHTYVKGQDIFAIRSCYPQTILDPRPFAGAILANRLSGFIDKESIIVIFATREEDISYEFIQISKQGIESSSEETYNTYSFIKYLRLPNNANVIGDETHVVPGIDSDFYKLLARHNKEATYSITFQHPTIWDSQQGKQLKRTDFIPLMLTSDGRIVAYADFDPKTSIFVFPYIDRKGEFLVEFLQNVLPSFFPKLFPYSTQFSWLADPKYQLPNEKLLVTEKRRVEERYVKKIEESDKKLQDNYDKYSWLHGLLTKTDAPLVREVERYFKWLGFPKVTNVDEENPSLKEEDLQVTTDKGLLVIEVKGISGTSTDADCSQIAKIKYRRAKQRKNFDVFALYIVNHQRFISPGSRTNPPFAEQQIADAINEERGLLTTYSLFKLYNTIDAGLITKADARRALLQFGLIKFIPSNALYLGKPSEVYYNGQVVVLDIADFVITQSSNLIAMDGEELRQMKILEIRIENKAVESASNTKVSIKFAQKLNLTSELWLVQS